jgi:hypothetical protein
MLEDTVRSFSSLVCVVLMCACAGARNDDDLYEPTEPPTEPPGGSQQKPAQNAERTSPVELGALSAVDLTAILPETAQPVGVAVEPGTYRRYVLDAVSGLYDIEPSGAAALVFDTRDPTLYGVSLASRFTDVVALGSGRFAVTATDDGFILDINAQTLTQHFCYFPSAPASDVPEEDLGASERLVRLGIAAQQHTESVTYNRSLALLYAQPQTMDLSTSQIVASEIGLFDAATGDPVDWIELPNPSFLAGGMAVYPGDRLLVGEGTTLFEATNVGALTQLRDYGSKGVTRIDGLAYDAGRSSVLVLDGAAMWLVEISAVGL